MLNEKMIKDLKISYSKKGTNSQDAEIYVVDGTVCLPSEYAEEIDGDVYFVLDANEFKSVEEYIDYAEDRICYINEEVEKAAERYCD